MKVKDIIDSLDICTDIERGCRGCFALNNNKSCNYVYAAASMLREQSAIIAEFEKTELSDELYNGLIVCWLALTPMFTRGKVYYVHNGVLIGNNGITYDDKFRSLDEINDKFDSQFIEFVGEL